MERGKTAYWYDMIMHISETYLAFRGYKYPWIGRNFRELKGMARIYKPWGVMALWDNYLLHDNVYAKKTGYSIYEFCRQMPWLLDTNWKPKAAEYEKKLTGEPSPPPGLIESLKLKKKP